jgi:hypothetical protein
VLTVASRTSTKCAIPLKGSANRSRPVVQETEGQSYGRTTRHVRLAALTPKQSRYSQAKSSQSPHAAHHANGDEAIQDDGQEVRNKSVSTPAMLGLECTIATSEQEGSYQSHAQATSQTSMSAMFLVGCITSRRLRRTCHSNLMFSLKKISHRSTAIRGHTSDMKEGHAGAKVPLRQGEHLG